MKVNKFLNHFLCSLLSLTLILSQQVHAQSATLDGTTSSIPTNSTHTTDESTAITTQEGTTTTQDPAVVKIEGNDTDPKQGMIFSTIGMFAAGFMAPGLVIACPQSWSVRAFAASSALYILNETGLFSGFNKATNAEMAAYKNRGDEDKQIDSLLTAAKQTAEAKEAAKKRALISKIAAGGFGVSAALAAGEAAQWWEVVDCVPLMGLYEVPNGEGRFILKESKSPELFTENSPLESKSFIHELDKMVIHGQEQLAWDNNLKAQKLTVSDVLTIPLAANVFAEDKERVVNSGMTKILAAGVGAAGAVAISQAASGPMSGLFKTITDSKYGRVAAFAAFAGIAYMSARESEKAAEALEKNENEYKRLAEALMQQTQQGTTITPGTGGTPNVVDVPQPITIPGTGSTGNGGEPVCFNGGAASGLSVSSSCGCAKTNTCATAQIPPTNEFPNISGADAFVSDLKSLSDATNSALKGNTEGAITGGNSLTSNAARTKKLKDALLKKINDDRKADNKNPINFDKATEGYTNALESAAGRAYASMTPEQQNGINGLASPFGDLDDSESEDKDDDDKYAAATGVSAEGALAEIGGSGSDLADKKANGALWDFNFDDDKNAAKDKQAALEAELAKNEKQDYVIDSDINDDKNKDLFNIITKRYLKSAYPVFFEEE